MKKFKFNQDVKVQLWVRQPFTIEAETREEAEEIAKKYARQDITDTFIEDEDIIEFDEKIPLYDTETIIYETDSIFPTMEIVDDVFKRICNNCEVE